jgi:hypothetical protein
MRRRLFASRAVAVALGTAPLGVAAGAAGCDDAVAQPIGVEPGDSGALDEFDASVAIDSGAPPDSSRPNEASAVDSTVDSAADSMGDVSIGDVVTTTDGPVPDGPVRDATPACQPQAPILATGTPFCTGDLAAKFRFAVCACGSMTISGQLTTDSIDSTADAQAAGSSASIAANGALTTYTHTMLGGSVWASGASIAQGAPAVVLRGDGTIARDVQSGANLEVGGAFHVGGNVFANGSVVVDDPDAGDNLGVSGTLHVPEGGVVSPAVAAIGGVAVQPVSVPPPCDCSSPIQVFTIVSAAKNNNDDAVIGLAPTALENPPAPLSLPCGRYYVYGITGVSVHLALTGHVVLFVDGDVNVDNTLQVDLSPDAELDLFVAGSVGVGNMNMGTFGNTNAPGRVRLYVGGQALQLGPSVMVGANIYAPYATVTISSDLTMGGALLASEFTISAVVTIHYDPSVLAATGCTPPGGSCQTCNDCPGATPACVNRTCAACTTNADCCAPLVCSSGRCLQATR